MSYAFILLEYNDQHSERALVTYLEENIMQIHNIAESHARSKPYVSYCGIRGRVRGSLCLANVG